MISVVMSNSIRSKPVSCRSALPAERPPDPAV